MRLSLDRALLCLQLIVEGNSIRSTERITGVHRDTILALLVKAGERCEKLLAETIIGLRVRDVECDEMWGFVAMKEKAKGRERKDIDELGDAYTYVAIERNSKLILAWHLGKRNRQDTLQLIYEDLVDEGLTIVKGIVDRYEGARRNPWNEIECGSHYARALASWSVLLALTGYRYSAKDQSLIFAPLLNPEDFRCFFAAGSGWGGYRQQNQNGALAARLEVHHGQIPLRSLKLKNTADGLLKIMDLTGPGGRTVAGKLVGQGKDVTLQFADPVIITAGNSLSVRLSRDGRPAAS